MTVVLRTGASLTEMAYIGRALEKGGLIVKFAVAKGNEASIIVSDNEESAEKARKLREAALIDQDYRWPEN